MQIFLLGLELLQKRLDSFESLLVYEDSLEFLISFDPSVNFIAPITHWQSKQLAHVYQSNTSAEANWISRPLPNSIEPCDGT